MLPAADLIFWNLVLLPESSDTCSQPTHWATVCHWINEIGITTKFNVAFYCCLSTPTDTLTTSCRPFCTFTGELFKDGVCCFPQSPDHICFQGYLISCPTAQTGRKPPCPCSLFTGHCPPLKGPGPTTGTTPPERSSGLVVHGLEWEGKVVVDVTASQLVPREFIH